MLPGNAAVGDRRSNARRRVETWDPATAGAQALRKRALWHELNFEFALQILALEFLILADIRTGRTTDAFVIEQDAQPPTIDAAVVRNRNEVGRALLKQCLDQVVRDAVQAETAYREACAAWNICDGQSSRREDFVHRVELMRRGPNGLPLELKSPRKVAWIMSIAPPRAHESEEEAMILQMVRELVAEKVAPRAAEIDETQEFPVDIKELFAQNDLMGIPIPTEYGGLGGTFVTYVKVVEEIAKACASSSLIVAVQELGMLPILIGGSDEQKKRFLPDIASGKKIAAYALTEVSSGSDALGSMKTRAERKGDNYLLTGQKIWITNGSVADVVCVFAVTDPAAGSRGVSAFVVEKGSKGFTVGKKEKKMGIRGSPTVELIFDNCEVPAANRLGEEGEGFKIAMKVLDKSRPGIAAQALGIAAGALDYATNYAKDRVAFGKPIGQHQGVGFMLADMKTEVEAARLLLYESARKCDEGAVDVSLWASMAKLKCGDVAMSVTTDAVQVLGGFGYSAEYPVERMMRDAKITQIYEGTQQIQRLVISRNMVGKGK